MPHHMVMGLRVLLLDRHLDLGSQAVREGPAVAHVAGDPGKQVGAGFTQLGACVWCLVTLPGDLHLSGTVSSLDGENSCPLTWGLLGNTVLLFSCGTLQIRL